MIAIVAIMAILKITLLTPYAHNFAIIAILKKVNES